MLKRNSFQFLPGLEGHGDIQIRTATKKDHVFVTIGKKRVVEYNLNEKQVVVNYFVPSHITLSTPLVFDTTSGQVVCVVNKVSLIMWDGNQSHLDKIPEASKMPSPVRDLSLSDDGKVWVIFVNGDVQLLDSLRRNSLVTWNPCPHQPTDILKSRILWHGSACLWKGEAENWHEGQQK